MAVIVTIAWIAAIIYQLRITWRSNVFIKAIKLASEVFQSSIHFFASITSIASFFQITRSTTYYERSLNALITFFLTNICIALLLIQRSDSAKEAGVKSLFILMAYFTAIILYSFSITALVDLKNTRPNSLTGVSTFGNSDCFIEAPDAINSVLPLSITQTIILSLAFLIFITTKWSPACLNLPLHVYQQKKGRFWYLKLTFSTIGMILLWSNLATIYRLRSWGQEYFGPSFQDTKSISYGQIIAIFFSLETVAVFLHSIIYCKYTCTELILSKVTILNIGILFMGTQ
jgi:hypothetical protein